MSRSLEIKDTLQICAGAKGASCAGDNADAEVWFAVQPVPYTMELMVTGIIHAIELLGSIQGDEQDVRSREGEGGE